MPDVLFLEVNSSYSHSMLSYGMLRAYTERFAPEWRWHKLELAARKPDTALLKEKLLALKPEVVCGTAYLFNVRPLLALCREVRAVLPPARIALGGPEFPPGRACPPEADAVISGDETTFHRYLTHNEAVPGCYAGELDDLPSPHQLGYVTPGKPFWQIETSRGCGGRCTFCTSSASKQVKCHSPERVRADLLALRQAGFREIRVLDRTFNRNQARAAALLKMFRTEFPEIRFHLEIEPFGLKPEFLDELARGNLHVEAGVQSLNPAVLSACRRRGDAAGVLEGLRGLLGCGNFELHTDLIAGLPAQTLRSLADDVKTLIQVRPHEIQLELLKILPGTPLWETASDFNPEPPYEVRSTPEMNADDLRTALRLSQVLDNWYNAPQLRPAFIRAAAESSGFLDEFLAFMNTRGELFARGKLLLEERFRLLDGFLPGGPAREVLRFAAIAAGLSRHEYRDKIIPEGGRTLWRKPVDTVPGRCIVAAFDGNAGECFFDPGAAWEPGPRRYCFKLHYGRLPSEITALDPEPLPPRIIRREFFNL